MPKVTIILPNYNHQEYIEQRIDSILAQEYQDFELIILDDASHDQSTNLIKKYLLDDRIKEFLINDQNSGSTFVQWEKGLNMAEGEYIWIAESDDVAKSNFLLEMVKVLENQPKVGLVYCPSIWIDSNGIEIHQPNHEEGENSWAGLSLIQNEFLAGNVIYNASSAVFRKEMLKNVSFEQIRKFKYAGDWFFWVQLIQDQQVVRIKQRLNFFRRHDGNVSFKSESEGLQFIEGIQIVKYIFKNYGVSFWKKRATMAFWTRKLLLSDLKNPKKVLEKMPSELNFYYWILSFFK